MIKSSWPLVLCVAFVSFAFQANRPAYSSQECLASPDPDVLTLYVAPDGTDGSEGTCENPLASLNGAHKWIKQHDPNVTEDYLIYVREGRYLKHAVGWSVTSTDHTITIEAYPGETPVFDGEGSRVWFSLKARPGACTNIHIRGLTIREYVSYAILLHGDRSKRSRWNGCNVVADNVFIKIGNRYNTANCRGCTGYGAIDAVNSRYNTFEDNVFHRIENNKEDARLMHAVYLAHSSSNNVVQSNYVSFCSGDPIKTRDGSNYNEILENYLDRSGFRTFIVDWPSNGEEPSTGNVVADNLLTFPHHWSPESKIPATMCRESCSKYDSFHNLGQLLHDGRKVRREHVGAMAAGDFDGDGDRDLVVALNYDGFTKVVSTAGGADRFLRTPLYVSKDWSVEDFAVGDFDGTGRDQLVTHFRSRNGGTSQLYRGRAVSSVFEQWPSSLLDLGLVYESNQWNIEALTVGSFAGPGDELITAVRSRQGQTQIYRGDAVSDPLQRLLYSGSQWRVAAMTAGDFDGDARDELITGFNSSRRTRIYKGDGISSATNDGYFYDSTRWRVGGLAAGDFDGTGTMQLATGFTPAVGKEMRVYRGDDTSPTRFGFFYENPYWSAGDMTVGEYNGHEGNTELVTSFVDDDENQIWVGNGVDDGQDEGIFHRYRSRR